MKSSELIPNLFADLLNDLGFINSVIDDCRKYPGFKKYNISWEYARTELLSRFYDLERDESETGAFRKFVHSPICRVIFEDLVEVIKQAYLSTGKGSEMNLIRVSTNGYVLFIQILDIAGYRYDWKTISANGKRIPGYYLEVEKRDRF